MIIKIPLFIKHVVILLSPYINQVVMSENTGKYEK